MKKHTGTWLGIMIHHSAGNSSDTVESIRKIHKNKNKWGDIGYHYVIEIKDGHGYLKNGRSTAYAGAHAGVDYYNNKYIGVCIVGNYSERNIPNTVYSDVLSAICHLCGKYDCCTILGHCEVKATECPGTKFPLSKLKNDIKKRFGK